MTIEEIILSCKKEGDFTLHSGEKSSYLFDVMKLLDKRMFHRHLGRFVKDECLVGIEFGGAILAAAGSQNNHQWDEFGIAYTRDRRFGIIRKDGTLYGYIPDNYTLIDDVVTTENSIRKAIEQIGKEPEKIKCIVDRRKVCDLQIESMLRWVE